METEKEKKVKVKVPKTLIYQVDRIVTQSGLYSSEEEFVTDAVRRLIILSKTEETKKMSDNEKWKNDGFKLKNEIPIFGIKEHPP